MAAPDIARLLAREAGHPSEAHRLAEAKAQALTEMGYHLPLFNGARELLEELRRRGVPYGLATNASRRFTDAVVAAQGLHFDAIVTLDEAPRPKPAPDVYQMCARMLGCSDASFRDVPVFEDSLFGLRGVAAAGMRPLGVESNHPGEELREAGAVLVFKDLAEALRQIDLWLKK
jgi:HAD superfamily hydrolase (TIGR01509 family)